MHMGKGPVKGPKDLEEGRNLPKDTWALGML